MTENEEDEMEKGADDKVLSWVVDEEIKIIIKSNEEQSYTD